jgi:hypothetical protein
VDVSDRGRGSADHLAGGGAVAKKRILYRTAGRERPGCSDCRTAAGPHCFSHHAALPPANGLTVATSWEKGLIAPPSEGASRWLWLRDNIPLAVTAFGLLSIVAYYAFAWRKVGHDPRRGTIIPLFGPPNGMSPAAVRYVSRMSCDDKTFSAALVDLAVHGHLKLAETRGPA